MKPLLNAILFLAWAAPAFAAPVLVRSGEHGTFTRIVVDTNPSAKWQLNQDGREVRLDLPQNREGFAIADVFRRITRARVQSISAGRQSLTLTLGCDCVVTATPMAPDYIILDIAPETPSNDPTAPDAAEQAAPDWAGSIAATEAYFGLADLTASGTVTDEELPELDPPARAAMEPAMPPFAVAPVVLPLVQDPAERTPFELEDPVIADATVGSEPDTIAPRLQHTGDALKVLEDRLTRQIGLAATQGVLQPARDHRASTPAAVADETPDASDAERTEATLDALFAEDSLYDNLRIDSSVDRRGTEAETIATAISGGSCVEADLFAVQDWGSEGGFGAEISQHRNALYGEFDKLDRTAQIALARAYIYYGFGAEALQIAALDVRDEKVDAAITVIARIMEYGPSPDTDRLTRFAECDTDAALWAILADNGSGRPERMNTDAALRALNKLPYHLRSFLAPKLSERLRHHGAGNAAAHAMRSVSRTLHEPESVARLEQAEIDLIIGDDEKASDGFEEVIENNSFEAPRALIRFIDLQVANEEAISKDTALLAAAYASEYRDSELEPEIARVHVMALAKSGQFDEAFAVLEAARGDGLAGDRMVDGFHTVIHAEADDVTFLRRTMALTESDLAQIAPRTRIDLSSRLLDLGFAEQAGAMIRDVDGKVAPRDLQLLRGRIHLVMGNHRQALAAAGTFDGEEFEALRADTLYATGDYGEAAAIYERLGQAERAESAAWKAPAGTVAAAPEDSSLSRVADIADRALPDAEGGLLARADALLTDSNELSSEIETLLANPDLAIGAGG